MSCFCQTWSGEGDWAQFVSTGDEQRPIYIRPCSSSFPSQIQRAARVEARLLRPEAARTEDRMFYFHRPPAPLQLQHRHPDSSSAASSSSRQPLCLESTATELSAPSAVATWDRVPASAPRRSRAVTGASASSIVATRDRVSHLGPTPQPRGDGGICIVNHGDSGPRSRLGPTSLSRDDDGGGASAS